MPVFEQNKIGYKRFFCLIESVWVGKAIKE